MAKISTYANDSAISSADKVIGSNAENANATVNFTMGGITSFVYNQTIAQTTSTILSQVVSNPTLGTITNHVLGQVVIAPTVETISDYVYNDQIGNITTHVLGEVVDAPTIETISNYVYTDQIGNITTHVLGQIPPSTQTLMMLQVLSVNSLLEDQGPSSQGDDYVVKFANQNASSTHVTYDSASRSFIFNQPGVYIINAFGRMGKGDNSNLVQLDYAMYYGNNPYGRPNAFRMKESNQRIPYEITFPIHISSTLNASISFHITRNPDAGFHNDGGLYYEITSYGGVPSAGVTIWKLILQ